MEERLLPLPRMYYSAQGPSQNWLLALGGGGGVSGEEGGWVGGRQPERGQAELSKGSGCSSHQGGGLLNDGG